MFDPQRPCPVEGCTQPHLDALTRACSQPMPPLRVSFPAGVADVVAAIDRAVAENAASIRKILDDHAASHTPAEYLDTIYRLRQQLARAVPGIRPHQPTGQPPPAVVAAMVAEPVLTSLPPELL